MYRVRFIWASRFLHHLFHIRLAVVYVSTLKSVSECASWINAFPFPQMKCQSVLYNLRLYPSLLLVPFNCIRVLIQHNSRQFSCHYHRSHWQRSKYLLLNYCTCFVYAKWLWRSYVAYVGHWPLYKIFTALQSLLRTPYTHLSLCLNNALASTAGLSEQSGSTTIIDSPLSVVKHSWFLLKVSMIGLPQQCSEDDGTAMSADVVCVFYFSWVIWRLVINSDYAALGGRNTG